MALSCQSALVRPHPKDRYRHFRARVFPSRAAMVATARSDGNVRGRFVAAFCGTATGRGRCGEFYFHGQPSPSDVAHEIAHAALYYVHDCLRLNLQCPRPDESNASPEEELFAEAVEHLTRRLGRLMRSDAGATS